MKLRKVGPATSKRAFTLIELLVVIAIIAILASLILGISGFVQEKAGNSRAEAEIKALETALENYKLDNGTYPEGDGSETSTEALVTALLPISSTEKSYFQDAPLRMLDKFRSKDSYETIRKNSKYFMDPFGNNYRYFFKAADAAAGTAAQNPVTGSQNNGPQFYDLWSYGKNPQKNQNNPAAWIKNW